MQSRRKGTGETQQINNNFPTGSEEENPEPIELSIDPYIPSKNSKRRTATDLVDLEFLEPIADKKTKIKSKLVQKATMDKLKELLQEIGELV